MTNTIGVITDYLHTNEAFMDPTPEMKKDVPQLEMQREDKELRNAKKWNEEQREEMQNIRHLPGIIDDQNQLFKLGVQLAQAENRIKELEDKQLNPLRLALIVAASCVLGSFLGTGFAILFR